MPPTRNLLCMRHLPVAARHRSGRGARVSQDAGLGPVCVGGGEPHRTDVREQPQRQSALPDRRQPPTPRRVVRCGRVRGPRRPASPPRHPLPLGAAMLALAAPDPTTLTLDRLFARRRESDAMMPAASASPTSARTRPRWCQSPASENYLPSKSASPVPARSRRPSAASNLRQRRHSSRLAAVPVLLVSLPVDTEDVAVCVMANQSECCRVPDG